MASALFKKFQDEQAKKDAEYKAWENDQWEKNKDQWTKEGYTRNTNPNSAWGSTWSKNPVINPPTNSSGNVQTGIEAKPEVKPETKVETKAETPAIETTTPTISKGFSFVGQNSYNTEEDFMKDFENQYKQYALQNKSAFGQPQFSENTGMSLIRSLSDIQSKNLQGYNNALQSAKKLYNYNNPASFLSDRWFGELVGLVDEKPAYTLINKNGGTMNKVKYFQQGGTAPQQDIQKQVISLVQAAMKGDQKATQTVNQIMQAAQQGDQQAMQLAQMIQQVAKQIQGQATSAKWGSKLQYIKSLKFAKGGKTCPVCDEGTKVKVAKKDIDKETYQRLSSEQKTEADRHYLGTATSDNKDGSYNISHKPSAQDSTHISRKIMSKGMSKKYPEKKECGGKAKKHYFGGWL